MTTQSTARPISAYLRLFACDRVTDALWDVTVAWAAVQSGSATAAGTIVLLGVLPQLVVMPFGGAVADRLGTRSVIGWTLLSRLVILVAFAGLVSAADFPWPILALLVACWGATDAIHMPSLQAIPGSLTEEGDGTAQRKLQGKVASVRQAAMVVGGGLGGVLVASSLPWTSSVLGAALTLGAVLNLRWLGKAGAPGGGSEDSIWQELKEGVRYVWRNPTYRMCLLLFSFTNLLVSPVVLLGVPFLAENEGWSWQYGLIYGSVAVGGVAGGLLLNKYGDKIDKIASPLVTASGLLIPMGVLAALLVQTTNLYLEVPVALGSGVLAPLVAGTLIGELMGTAPQAYHGRIMSLVTWSALSLMPLGSLLFGWLVDTIGLTAAGAWMSGGLVLVGVIGLGGQRLTLRKV